MKVKLDKALIIKFLVALLVLNYMVVTIIFHDNIILKYLRDILLILLLIPALRNFGKVDKIVLYVLLFTICLFVGIFQASSVPLAITSIRRYVFPLILFLATRAITGINMKGYLKLGCFFLEFLALIGIWGIFQAQILGDVFLKQLGYPSSYSYSYGRIMLNSSFYFGGLGIQRVVSTLSNSNVCALIFGTAILFYIYNNRSFAIKHRNFLLIVLLFTYLLTFSRANFLAMLILLVTMVYPYIHDKFKMFIGLFSIAALLVVVYFMQGESGILFKIVGWIQQSLSFTESSAAGRTGIWYEAFQNVLSHPLGIGLGRVGSLARDAVVPGFLNCENSYMAIALDTGWLGLLVYLLIQAHILKELTFYRRMFKKDANAKMERLCKCCTSLYIYFGIAMFFSNHIYDMEATSILYCIVGLSLSLCRKRKEDICI